MTTKLHLVSIRLRGFISQFFMSFHDLRRVTLSLLINKSVTVINRSCVDTVSHTIIQYFPPTITRIPNCHSLVTTSGQGITIASAIHTFIFLFCTDFGHFTARWKCSSLILVWRLRVLQVCTKPHNNSSETAKCWSNFLYFIRVMRTALWRS